MFDRYQYEAGLLAMAWVDDDNSVTDVSVLQPEWFADAMNRGLLFKMREYKAQGRKHDPLPDSDFFGMEGVKRLMEGFKTFRKNIYNWPGWVKWFEADYLKKAIANLTKNQHTSEQYNKLFERLKEIQKPARSINEGTMKVATADAISAISDEMHNIGEKYHTGIANLDSYITSLRPKRFYIIGGRPGSCKTNLALKIMLNNVTRKVPVIYFSSEMGAPTLISRMASMRVNTSSTITYSSVIEGKLDKDEFAEFSAILNELYFMPGLFLETSRFSMDFIKDKVIKYEAKIVILDFVQMFRLTEVNKDNRAAAMSEIASQLKELAMDRNIVVIGLSQLNQQGELKESSSLNEKADAVITLSVEGNSIDIKTIKADITKNRYGDTGYTELMLIKRTLNFS